MTDRDETVRAWATALDVPPELMLWSPGRTAEARRDLLAAVVGLDLTAEEMATVQWVMQWCEPMTVEHVASVIGKAREAGEQR